MYLEQGFEAVQSWLVEVMTPFVEDGYLKIREEYGISTPPPTPLAHAHTHENPNNPQASGSAAGGHLALFNQHCQQHGLPVKWQYCPVPEGNRSTPVWTVDAWMEGKFVGTGKGNTKKAARNEAAKQGLRFLG